MKKLLVTMSLVLSFLMFFSCAIPMNYSNLDMLMAEVPTFDTVHKAWAWINHNIRPKNDPLGGLWDTWQTPEETLARRTGDCEDVSILLMYFIHNLGEDSLLILCLKNNTPHVIVKYNGQYLESFLVGVTYTGNEDNIQILGVLASSYEAALGVAEIKSVSVETDE